VSESLLKPLFRGEMADVLLGEHEAKHVATQQLRELRKTASASSKALQFARRRANAASLRREWDNETGKDIAVLVKDIPPASEAEISSIAVQLCAAMCKKWPEARAQSSSFRLFRMMDCDNSGLISFYELTKMIRESLKISSEKVSERDLLKVWRAIDVDCDGTINAGEFLRIVRGGWNAFKEARHDESGTKLAHVLDRPNWTGTSFIPMDRPAWREQTMTLAEKRRYYIDSAKMDVNDRTIRYQEIARQSQAAARAWKSKVREADAHLPPKLGRSTSSSSAVSLQKISASAPTLR